MTARIDFQKFAPEAYQAMRGLEEYLAAAPVPKSTLELVRLRASQLNGCAFCVDMHTHDAHESGEGLQRLFSVVTWRETPFFTDAERAALALTEEATRLSPEGVSDEVWNTAAEHYDERELAALVTCIATINAWNRLAITTRAMPSPRD